MEEDSFKETDKKNKTAAIFAIKMRDVDSTLFGKPNLCREIDMHNVSGACVVVDMDKAHCGGCTIL